MVFVQSESGRPQLEFELRSPIPFSELLAVMQCGISFPCIRYYVYTRLQACTRLHVCTRLHPCIHVM